MPRGASFQYLSDNEKTETASNSSSTMQEDDSLLSEDGGLAENSRVNRNIQRQFVNWRIMLFLLNILLFTTGIVVWIHVIFLSKNLHCDMGPQKTKFEPDLMYSSRVTFQPHKFYGGPPTNTTNEMWKRLSPPGDGIVAIPRKYTANLPPSAPAPNDPDADVYGISMFHQLHCLNFLRFAYYPDSITTLLPDEVVYHRDHCLDYIRQALMCHGDTTFEIVTEVGINGMGATHQCRDFDKLFSWAYEQRSDTKHGSGYTGGHITHTPAQRNDFDH